MNEPVTLFFINHPYQNVFLYMHHSFLYIWYNITVNNTFFMNFSFTLKLTDSGFLFYEIKKKVTDAKHI